MLGKSIAALALAAAALTVSAVPGTAANKEKGATVHHGELVAVSCPSATKCTAVGALTTPPGAAAEDWNGKTWSVARAPKAINGLLWGVSCTSATACTAVGDNGTSLSSPVIALTLAERWNGTTWAIQPTPKPAGTVDRATLYSVSCTSTTACTAVGQLTMGTRTHPKSTFMMAEGWNGKKWTIEPTPEPRGTINSSLSSVSCSSANSCVAVGNYGSSSTATGSGPFALVEGWNGKRWAYALPSYPRGICVGGPTVGCTVDSEFLGVSCTSVKACTAVGQYIPFEPTALYISRTLAERWNGKHWTFESSANPSSKGATANYLQLNSVSCASANACTAVGQYDNRSGTRQPVAEGWNGTKWVIEPSPSTANKGNYLSGVSCKSSQCVAVGVQNTSINGETLAEGWNGNKWVIET